MQAAAFTPKHVNPAAQLLGDAVGQRLHPVLDRTFVRIDLAVGIGDEHGALGEELHDPAGVGPWPVGRQRPDVRFVERGVGAYPGQHDAQAPGRQSAELLVPVSAAGAALKLVQQRLRRWGERGQVLQTADADAAPVPPYLEQDALRGIEQVW
jgi:hypothetical protein